MGVFGEGEELKREVSPLLDTPFSAGEAIRAKTVNGAPF